MKNKLKEELRNALDAFESGPLVELINKNKKEHFLMLKEMLSEGQDLQKGDLKKAIYALGRWGDKDTLSDIIKVMPRLDVSERITAIDALSKMISSENIDVLTKYSQDESEQVRKMVVNALDAVGGKKALNELKLIYKNDSKPWVRELAHDCLLKKRKK